MIRTLHVDIEGGWGGSSRSLFELISRLDRARVAGPVAARCREIRVPTEIVPEIGSFVPRKRNSARVFLARLPMHPYLDEETAEMNCVAIA